MAKRAESDIPGEVYVQFVKSLYGSRGTILFGATAHLVIALLVYANSGQPIFLAFGLILFAIAVVRYLGIRKGPEAVTDPHQARILETDYVIKGATQGVLLGAFGFFSPGGRFHERLKPAKLS